MYVKEEEDLICSVTTEEGATKSCCQHKEPCTKWITLKIPPLVHLSYKW